MRFIEKPDPTQAERLLKKGALWNTFVIVGTARGLLDLFRVAQSDLLRQFLECVPEVCAGSEGAADELYRNVPTLDFSLDVLERVPEHLMAFRVASCGWTDLGTPRRLRKWQESVRSPIERPASSSGRKDDALRPSLAIAGGEVPQVV